MATIRPSYVKRQKEQKRKARALEKRNARIVRKQAKTTPMPGEESVPQETESSMSDSE